jgi:hypothetical protein
MNGLARRNPLRSLNYNGIVEIGQLQARYKETWEEPTARTVSAIGHVLSPAAIAWPCECWASSRVILPIWHNLVMCGRYRLARRKQIVEEYFDSVSGQGDWGPRYNIAPTQPVPVIRQNPKEPVREMSLMRWGLIPSWAKEHY